MRLKIISTPLQFLKKKRELILQAFLTGSAAALLLISGACGKSPHRVISPTPTADNTPSAVFSAVLPSPTPSPSLTPTFPAGCADQNGRIEVLEIEDPSIPKPLRVRLFLPPCYNPARSEPYPLLVLLHGQSYDDSQWEKLGITHDLEERIINGQADPAIIVMPFEEYQYRDPAESYFGSAISGVLLPWAETQWNVSPLRQCHAIGGISRGAAWAVHLGFVQWQFFGVIGAHSLPLFPADSSLPPVWEDNIPADQMPVFFMDSGDIDPYKNSTALFHETLLQYHIPHQWEIHPGAHEDIYWQSQVNNYLDEYLNGLKNCF